MLAWGVLMLTLLAGPSTTYDGTALSVRSVYSWEQANLRRPVL